MAQSQHIGITAQIVIVLAISVGAMAYADESSTSAVDRKVVDSVVPGLAEYQLGHYRIAIDKLTKGIKSERQLSRLFYYRGMSYRHTGQYVLATNDLRVAISLNPKDAEAHDQLALISASAPNDDVRDGDEAVKSATQACELSGWARPDFITTLAAAYAELGQFKTAELWHRYAIRMLGFKEREDGSFIATDFIGAEDAIKRLDERLRLYENKKPYRFAGTENGSELLNGDE